MASRADQYFFQNENEEQAMKTYISAIILLDAPVVHFLGLYTV